MVLKLTEVDAKIAALTVLAYEGSTLSHENRRHTIKALANAGEPLARQFETYLQSMDYPADELVLKDSDLAERLLTGDISDDHYNAVLEGRMGVGGGRGKCINLTETYIWHYSIP